MLNILRKTARTALTALLLLTLCAAPALADGRAARINNSDCKIYNSDGDCVSLPKGTRVTVTDSSKSWAEVRVKGVTGYVRVKYLTAEEGLTGYVKTKAPLYKSASSSSTKLGTLSVGTKVEVVGRSGSYCQVTNGSVYGYVETDCLSKTKPRAESWTSKVRMTSWFDGGSGILDRGDYGYIYDVKTGISLRIKRMGGSNHADVEPASKADTLKLKKIAGGTFSWDSRAVILYADGVYVAAAINTMPHGDQTISDNGYDGQFCLHLLDSKTHGSDTENALHQDSVRAAYKWAKSH